MSIKPFRDGPARIKSGHIAGMYDLVIDRTPAQKEARLNKLRLELLDMGYSVVRTDWLHSSGMVRALEAAE